MKLKKNLKSIIIALIATLPLLLNSCNEQPTSLGYSLVKDTVDIYAINSNELDLIVSDETFHFPMNFLSPGFSLIGKSNDLKSGVLMRFGLIPDSLDYLTTDDIVSCEIALQPRRYAMGDTAGSNFLSFGIYDVKSRWVVETSREEFFSGSLYSNPFTDFSGAITRKDTMDKIILPFSKTVLLEWLKIQAAKTDTVWGIALVPNENSTIIQQFHGAGPAGGAVPQITFVYKNKNNELDTIDLYSSMEKNFSIGEQINDDRLVVQGALAYYSKLSFDFTMIPKFAGIHQAELVLTIDRNQSYSGNFPLDTIVRLDYYTNYDDFLAGKSPDMFYAGRREPDSDKFIVPSITSAVSYWNRRNGIGNLIVGFDNVHSTYSLNKLAFHNSKDSDISKRPKLTVIYSVLKLKDE